MCKKVILTEIEWITCPICKNKTRVKVREDTEHKEVRTITLKILFKN